MQLLKYKHLILHTTLVFSDFRGYEYVLMEIRDSKAHYITINHQIMFVLATRRRVFQREGMKSSNKFLGC